MKKIYTLILFFTSIIYFKESYCRSIQDIQGCGSIKIGVRKSRIMLEDSDPPVSYIKDSKRSGIDVEISEIISNELGVYPIYKELNSPDDRIPSLENDDVDVVIDSLTITEKRMEKIDFASPEYVSGAETGLMIINKWKNKIKTWEDLKKFESQIRVAVYGKDSSTVDALKEYHPSINIVFYSSGRAAYEALIKQKVDGFSQDYPILLAKLRDGDNKYYLLDGQIGSGGYGVGVSKKHSDLRDKISLILLNLKTRGELKTIYEKHTGYEIRSVDMDKDDKGNLYRVEIGDTLMKIANKLCGHPTKWEILKNKNNIKSPYKIVEGDNIVIPSDCKNIALSKPVILSNKNKLNDSSCQFDINKRYLLNNVDNLYFNGIINRYYWSMYRKNICLNK